jgi:hypothetical protein
MQLKDITGPTDELSGEVDPINMAICPLIAAVFELTAPDSAERARAMVEVLQAAERIKQALAPLPRLQ